MTSFWKQKTRALNKPPATTLHILNRLVGIHFFSSLYLVSINEAPTAKASLAAPLNVSGVFDGIPATFFATILTPTTPAMISAALSFIQ